MSEDLPSPQNPGSPWPYQGNAPAHAGSGLAGQLQNPALEMLKVGRVVDVYTNPSSCLVQIPRRTAGAGIRCVWLGAAINRWGGVADFHPPEVGSLVLVYELASTDMGVVLGQFPSITTNPDPKASQYLFPDRAVDSFGDSNGQSPELFGTTGETVNAGQGMPMDALPGDKGFVGEFGQAVYCLRLLAGIKGSEMAKVEAFVLDDLVRVTAGRLEVFDAGGEHRTYNDNGRITTESCGTLSGAEADGLIGESKLDVPDPDAEEEEGNAAVLARQTGRWRWKFFRGHLGDLFNLFVCSPRDAGDSLGKATLDAPEKPENRDLGLSHLHLGTDGAMIARSILGMGFVKSRSIAVPKKRHEADDPEGDTKPHDPSLRPKDFEFKPESSPSQQIRDYLAYMNSVHIPANLVSRPLDWDMPDESDDGTSGCPQVDPEAKGGNVGTGGFLREMPTPVDGATIDPEEFKGRFFYVNDALVVVLPDGSVVIRDGWGSQAFMGRGSIDYTASCDINLTAGRNINLRAGNDVTVSGRKSVDVVAATGQARLHAGSDIQINSREGGVMVSTDSTGHKLEEDKRGEEQGIPGIVFKSGGEVLFSGQAARFDIGNYIHFRGLGKDARPPQMLGQFSRMLFDVEGGDVAYRFGDEHYVQIGGSGYSIRASGTIHTEGDLEAYLGNLIVQNAEVYELNANSVATREFDEEGAGTAPAPGKRWESVIDGLSPNFVGRKASGGTSKSRRNSARARVELKADNSAVLGGTPFDWKELVRSVDPELLGKFLFTFRTERDYGTEDLEDFAIFEGPWQREWSETTDWGNGGESEETKTAEYPGWSFWSGDRPAFVRYEEENVSPSGASKKREQLKADAGKITRTGLRQMPRHP